MSKEATAGKYGQPAHRLRVADNQHANEILLDRLLKDYQNLVLECRKDGMAWGRIAKASGLPEWVVRCIAGDIAKRRMSRDRQSGR